MKSVVKYKCEYTAITEQEDEYMIELIVSDMDGTLLNDKMEISASNVSAINEANRLGIKFMVATGRGYAEAVPALKEVGIDCPMITLNGGQVFDEDGQLVENLGIDKTTTRRILEDVKKYGLYCEIMTSKGIFSDDKVRRIESITSLLHETNPDTTFKMALVLAVARLEVMHVNYVDDFKDVLDDNTQQVLKILVFSDSGQGELEPIRTKLAEDSRLVVTSSFRNNIEINHVEAQKGIALEKFAKKRGIPLENVMAIGDNFNDVSMLKVAGASFAVANAEDGVKVFAKHLTSKNSENGVAEAIMRCINENL